MPDLLGQPSPLWPLAFASLLLLTTMIDMQREHHRPLWLRLVLRVVVFAALTWLIQRAIGLPVAPEFPPARPGEKVWGQLVQIGWWMLGARVAVGIIRLAATWPPRRRSSSRPRWSLASRLSGSPRMDMTAIPVRSGRPWAPACGIATASISRAGWSKIIAA